MVAAKKRVSGSLRVAVLVTTFNRVDTTLANLGALLSQSREAGLETTVFLVDDRSPDGTADAVRSAFPEVVVSVGSGDLFWCGGTAAAFRLAEQSGEFDAFMLFNDDVHLEDGALSRLIDEFVSLDPAGGMALVGPCLSSEGELTYSGYTLRTRYRPLRLSLVEPAGSMVRCDTFNGNCVLVDATLMDRTGGVDAKLMHMFGDLDLGMQITRAGGEVYVASSPVGVCDRGSPPVSRLRGKTRVERLRFLFTGPFGLYPLVRYSWRNGPRWIVPMVALKSSARRFWMAMSTSTQRVSPTPGHL